MNIVSRSTQQFRHGWPLVAALLDVKFERKVTPALVRAYPAALVIAGFRVLFGLL